MAKISVRPTIEAKESLKMIKEYILHHHTNKEYKKLLKKIAEHKKLLEVGNVNYKYSSKYDVYKIVIHKYSSMYYRKIDKNNTHIIFFRDNRMNNENNLFEE